MYPFLTRKSRIDTDVPKKTKKWPYSIPFKVPVCTRKKPLGEARKNLPDDTGDKAATDLDSANNKRTKNETAYMILWIIFSPMKASTFSKFSRCQSVRDGAFSNPTLELLNKAR